MPCYIGAIAVGVKENDYIGKIIVVVDNIGQIDVGFSAFVSRSVERCVGIVHSVDSPLPAVGRYVSLAAE